MFKKRKTGTKSSIAELRSPYLKKNVITLKNSKKPQKRRGLFIPSAPLKTTKRGIKGLVIILVLLMIISMSYLIIFSHFFDLKTWEIIEEGTRLNQESPIYSILAKEKNKNLIFISEKK